VSNGVSEGDFVLSGADMLDRSSADFDHTLREIDRRSPIPPLDGVKDLDDDGDVGREGIGSNPPGLGIERSKTDLGNSVSKKSQYNGVMNGRGRRTVIRDSSMPNSAPTRINVTKRERHVGLPAGTTDVVVNAH